MENNESIDVAARIGAVIGIVVSVGIYGLAIGPLIYSYMQ